MKKNQLKSTLTKQQFNRQIKSLKKVAKRYLDISYREYDAQWEVEVNVRAMEKRFDPMEAPMANRILKSITGFGNMTSCLLCKEVIKDFPRLGGVLPDCSKCIWSLFFDAHTTSICADHSTYNKFSTICEWDNVRVALESRSQYILLMTNLMVKQYKGEE